METRNARNWAALLLLAVAFGTLAAGVPSDAAAQGHSVVACRDRSGALVPCLSGGDSGGSYYSGGCNVICQFYRNLFAMMIPSGPSAQEVAHNRSNGLNNEGCELAKAGRKEEAITKFGQAIAVDPANVVAQSNYFGVLAELDMLAGRFENSLENSRRALVFARSSTYAQYGSGQATQIHNIEDNVRLVERVIADQTAIARRDFANGRNELLGEVRHLGGPKSGGPTVGEKTGSFGSTELKPRGLDASPAGAKPTLAPATALGQLQSIATSSGQVTKAKETPSAFDPNLNGPAEQTKQKSNCGFDTPGCAPVVNTIQPFQKTSTDPPAVAALKNRIPGNVQDTRIDESVKWFAKLEGQKADTQTELKAVQHQIIAGQGDPAVLTAREQTLQNDLKRIDGDQATVRNNIKSALKDDGVTWEE